MSRDITLADTIYILFTTRAFATGIPTTLAGTPVVSAYEDDGLTQITAGITLGVDHDSVTGLNLLTIVATGANGYGSGQDYSLVITTGTVGGVSVVGEVVGSFTIGRSAAAVDLAAGVLLADGAHGGSSAVLTLKQAVISGANGATGSVAVTNSTGPGEVIKSTGSNGDAVRLEAHGTGHGLHAQGDVGIHGRALAGSTLGYGIWAESEKVGNGIGLYGDAVSGGNGIQGTGGGANGHGLLAFSSGGQYGLAAQGISGAGGIQVSSQSANAIDILAVTGHGIAFSVSGAGKRDVDHDEPTDRLESTTIATLASQTSFTLTAGSADDDAYNGATIVITDATTVTQKAVGQISDYTGSTKTVTLSADPGVFTIAATDMVDIFPAAGLVSTATSAQLVDDVWDEVLTGATHNVASSSGRRLRQIDAAFDVHAGTAQAGTSTTITLDTGASATDDIYNGDRIVIVGGTGAQEHGLVTDYNGTTKVATMSKAWVITPDATSEFEVLPADCDVETWNSTTVTGDGDWSELQTDVDAILVDTGTDGVVISAAGFTDIWATTAMTEDYAADGATATPAQMLYMIWSALSEFAIASTTITAKKLDGSTTAMTFTLDDGTNPTSRTRAT